MEYTKGEWRIHPQKGWERDDDLVIEADQLNPTPDLQERIIPIATILRNGQTCVPNNARLISASPDMYEALKTLIAKSKDNDTFGSDGITDAINAIRKAEGK